MSVLRVADVDRPSLALLLARYGLDLRLMPNHTAIPGSYWGDSEAGLDGSTLYARIDTPVHSVLHEAAHYLCMSHERRAELFRDAGGDDAEENAVCYLQILLADLIPGMGREQLCRDMDQWGYSFRLGSARVWFETDAEDARLWLLDAGIIDADGRISG